MSDNNNKKLYECRYEVIYYALAENPREAQLQINKVTDDDPFTYYNVSAEEFDPDTGTIDDSWSLSSGVYGTGNEYVTLEEAIEMVKSKKKDDRQMELPFMKENTHGKQEEDTSLPI